MKTIYLALACWDYEGSSVVKAFEDLDEANKFVKECQQHKNSRPDWFDESAGQSWEEWESNYQRWENSHIAEGYSSADSFIVSETVLVTK